MSCKKCEGKGWVEGYHGANNRWSPSVQQCPNKCNITGYSDEVQKRLKTGAKREALAHVKPIALPLEKVTPLYPQEGDDDDDKHYA